MPTRTTLLFSFALLLLIFLTSAQQAMACSCGPIPLDDKRYEKAKMILVGEVIEIKKGKIYRDNDTDVLKIKVERVWKEKAPEVIWLTLFDSKGYCGDLNPQVGTKYFMWVIELKAGTVVLGDCGASRPVEHAKEDLTYLAKKPSWSYAKEKSKTVR